MRFRKQQLAANVPLEFSIAETINARKYVYLHWFFLFPLHASRNVACKQAVFEQWRSTVHAAQKFPWSGLCRLITLVPPDSRASLSRDSLPPPHLPEECRWCCVQFCPPSALHVWLPSIPASHIITAISKAHANESTDVLQNTLKLFRDDIQTFYARIVIGSAVKTSYSTIMALSFYCFVFYQN